MDKKVQDSYKGLPLNVMAYTKEIFDALKSTEATIKINALFNYLRRGPQSDLTKQENLIEFIKQCATRKIVDKIKSNSGVEETEEAYLKRIAQDVYNTAKITENIRLGIDENGDVHFYVKFGKKKDVRDEYEINTEDTLTVVREIYQQFIIEIEDEEKPAMNYVLGVSTIKKVTEDDVRKIELNKLQKEQEEQGFEIARLQHVITESEKALRKMEEEKARREIEIETLVKNHQQEIASLKTVQEGILIREQKRVSELKGMLEEEKEKNVKLQQSLNESQKQMRIAKKEKLTKEIEIIEESEKKQQEIHSIKKAYQKEVEDERQIVINLRKKFEEQREINQGLQDKLSKCQEENLVIKKEKAQQEMDFLEELDKKQKEVENIKDPGQDKVDDSDNFVRNRL